MKKEIKFILKSAEQEMRASEDQFCRHLSKIYPDLMSSELLDEITVDYYGESSSVIYISYISVLDSQTLTVQPFEKNMISSVEKSISECGLPLLTEIKNDKIYVIFPLLTDEIRNQKTELRKEAYEKAKISVLYIQKICLEKLQTLILSEEEMKAGEEQIQLLADEYRNRLLDAVTMYT